MAARNAENGRTAEITSETRTAATGVTAVGKLPAIAEVDAAGTPTTVGETTSVDATAARPGPAGGRAEPVAEGTITQPGYQPETGDTRRWRRWRSSRTGSLTVSTDAAGHTAGWADTEVPTAATITPNRTAAAFFDVDNTMMRGASIYYLARGLAARKYFAAADLARFAWGQLRFRVMATENAGHMSRAKEMALAFVEGWRVDDLERLSEEIFDEMMSDRIWPGSRALAKQHLDAGERVWLVTAAPLELGRVIAQRLGLTGALGTVAEVVDGVYTGRLVGDLMHGQAKADAIAQLAAVEGLELSHCTAYSDSANDVPMLSVVGHAVAVNPDTALRRTARREGWQIRDFRTGRKAAKVAVPSALAAGVVAGGVSAGLAVRRRRREVALSR